jgi:hypothetical protein
MNQLPPPSDLAERLAADPVLFIEALMRAAIDYGLLTDKDLDQIAMAYPDARTQNLVALALATERVIAVAKVTPPSG